jgi:predicted acyltransferase
MNATEKGVVQTATTQAADSLGRTPGRLMALDIYRGLAVAGMIIVDNPGSDDKAYWAIKHTEWNGWSPADLIFP